LEMLREYVAQHMQSTSPSLAGRPSVSPRIITNAMARSSFNISSKLVQRFKRKVALDTQERFYLRPDT